MPDRTLVDTDSAQTLTNKTLTAPVITGLGTGAARTDPASLATVQDGVGIYVATVGGTVDAITLTPTPAIPAYVAGQTFRFIAAGANTGPVTGVVSGLASPKAITKNGGLPLVAGDLPAGSMVTMTYDGTKFIVTGFIDAISATNLLLFASIMGD